MTPEHLDTLWQFARGDLPTADFERWLYALPDDALPEDLTLQLLWCPYNDATQVYALRASLRQKLPAPAACNCHMIANLSAQSIFDWPTSNLQVADSSIARCFWLSRLSCDICGLRWLVASDELIYDIRLPTRADELPAVQTYAGLLAMAREATSAPRYADPFLSVEIPRALETLANDKQTRTLAELAVLLPIPKEAIRHHVAQLPRRLRKWFNP